MKVLDKAPVKILGPKLDDADFEDDKVQRLEKWGNWKPDCYLGDIYDSPQFKDGTTIIMTGIVHRTNFTITNCKGEVTILGQRRNSRSRL